MDYSVWGPMIAFALVALFLSAIVFIVVVSVRRSKQTKLAWQQYAADRGYRFEPGSLTGLVAAIEGAVEGLTFRIEAHNSFHRDVGAVARTFLKYPIHGLPTDFFIKVMRKQFGIGGKDYRVETGDPQFDASFVISSDDSDVALAMCGPAFRAGFQRLCTARSSLTLNCVRGTYDPRVYYGTEDANPAAPNALELYWTNIEQDTAIFDTALEVLISASSP